MANDISALALPEERDSLVVLPFNHRQVTTLKNTMARNLDNVELQLFVEVCSHLGLDPFQKQIYAIKRRSRDRNGDYVDAMVIQVGIDGYRVLAERSGVYAGQSQPYWCGDDGVWRDVWLEDGPPVAAKVEVYRVGAPAPTVAICRYSSFVQKDRNGNPSGKWADMPDHMLAVRAESHALRRAFPNVMEQVKREVRGTPTLIELEGYEAPQDRRLDPLPALDEGDDLSYADVPDEVAEQLDQYRREMASAKTAVELNQIKAEIDRFGYGEELQAEYMKRFRELGPETRRRAAS